MRSVTANVGTGCAILFALPFTIVGIGVLIAAARMAAAGRPEAQLFAFVCFGVAFTSVGIAVIAGALRQRKSILETEALRAQHPGEPWMWNREWASRRVGDQWRYGTWALWVFAVLWNAISAPILFFLPREVERGNYAVTIAFLFPIVGLGIIVMAVRATLRAMRFKRSTLILDTLPAPIGGALHGRVEVDYAPLADATSIVVRLAAVDRRSSGKSTTERIEWQEEYEVPRGSLVRTMNGVAIPIAVAIPHDAPQTRTEMPQMVWRLTVDAEVPGVDYTARFEVPVFRTATEMHVRTSIPHVPPPEPREPRDFQIAQTPAGRELRFPAFRAKQPAIVLLLMSVAWSGGMAMLLASDAPLLFKGVFVLFSIPLFWTTLEMLFASSTVVFAGDRIVVRRRFLFRTSEKTFARGDIQSARAKIGAQSGSRPYYDVELQTKDGKKVQVAKYVRAKREAEWVAAQIHGR